MNVVDSSAWLEYFADGPLASEFRQPILETGKLVVPSIVLYEVAKRIMQQRDERTALEVVAQMGVGKVVPLDVPLALEAARLGYRHKLPLADSVIYATAQQAGATLWTMDSHFRDLPGVRYFQRQTES